MKGATVRMNSYLEVSFTGSDLRSGLVSLYSSISVLSATDRVEKYQTFILNISDLMTGDTFTITGSLPSNVELTTTRALHRNYVRK